MKLEYNFCQDCLAPRAENGVELGDDFIVWYCDECYQKICDSVDIDAEDDEDNCYDDEGFIDKLTLIIRDKTNK